MGSFNISLIFFLLSYKLLLTCCSLNIRRPKMIIILINYKTFYLVFTGDKMIISLVIVWQSSRIISFRISKLARSIQSSLIINSNGKIKRYQIRWTRRVSVSNSSIWIVCFDNLSQFIHCEVYSRLVVNIFVCHNPFQQPWFNSNFPDLLLAILLIFGQLDWVWNQNQMCLC